VPALKHHCVSLKVVTSEMRRVHTRPARSPAHCVCVANGRDESAEARLFWGPARPLSEFERAKLVERPMCGAPGEGPAGSRAQACFGYVLVAPGHLLMQERAAQVARRLYAMLLGDGHAHGGLV
jgi:hypothetical protein